MNFDENFLAEMGLSAMPENEKQKFLIYIQKELEIRIGERISKGLSPDQLNEFDSLTDKTDIILWLKHNRPNYREIVHKTITEMKAEIKSHHAQLLSSSF